MQTVHLHHEQFDHEQAKICQMSIYSNSSYMVYTYWSDKRRDRKTDVEFVERRKRRRGGGAETEGGDARMAGWRG